MANWWLPMLMLQTLERLSKGEVLCRNKQGSYLWADGKKNTITAKAMISRGLLTESYDGKLHSTPTGRHELKYNSGRLKRD
jgi:hypothetical protein